MKLIFTIIAIALNFLATYATSYYIDSSNGNDSNDGITLNTPWKSMSKIVSTVFNPGDSILLKKGEIWNESLVINSSGNAGNPLYFGTYGNGSKPIINIVKEHKDNWTNMGNNIWRNNNVSVSPSRLLKDGVELLPAAWNFYNELGTRVPALVEWYFGSNGSDSNNYLYLYSSDDPTNHIISYSSGPYALELNKRHDIEIEGIEFIGGTHNCIAIWSCSNILLKNLDAGKYSYAGILLNSAKVDGSYKPTENVVIDECNVDSYFMFNYSQAGTTSGLSTRGAREGVLFWRLTKNCVLKNSTIKNWAHANINIFCPVDDNTNRIENTEVCNNKFYNNYLTSPDIAYGGRIAIDGYCHHNKIYNNRLIRTSVQSQFNGFENHIHHNIFNSTKATPLKDYKAGYAMSLQAYYTGVSGNIIENNLMIDCEHPGIVISGNNSKGHVINNIFRNNIIYNCGLQTGTSIQIDIDSKNYNNFGNIFENNLIYTSYTASTKVNFYGSIIDIASFNSQIGTNSYSIKDNLSFDPQFEDYFDSNYHLKSNSPCIDAGTTPLAVKDFDGCIIPFGAAPDIGLYEYGGTTGINEYKTGKAILAPNFAKNYFEVLNIQDRQLKKVLIYNMVGQVFSPAGISGNEINISNLPSGMYCVIIETDNSKTKNKLIKQ